MQSKDQPLARTARVSISEQKLRVEQDGHVLAEFPVSTSKYGIGFLPGSLKTPTGTFRISEKIGGGAPLWQVFRARVPVGELATPGGEEDLILTRILRLEGLDPENSNTLGRLIYIHGTNQEEQIGTPASHGCVRLKNQDMADLFEILEPGDLFQISV